MGDEAAEQRVKLRVATWDVRSWQELDEESLMSAMSSLDVCGLWFDGPALSRFVGGGTSQNDELSRVLLTGSIEGVKHSLFSLELGSKFSLYFVKATGTDIDDPNALLTPLFVRKSFVVDAELCEWPRGVSDSWWQSHGRPSPMVRLRLRPSADGVDRDLVVAQTLWNPDELESRKLHHQSEFVVPDVVFMCRRELSLSEKLCQAKLNLRSIDSGMCVSLLVSGRLRARALQPRLGLQFIDCAELELLQRPDLLTVAHWTANWTPREDAESRRRDPLLQFLLRNGVDVCAITGTRVGGASTADYREFFVGFSYPSQDSSVAIIVRKEKFEEITANDLRFSASKDRILTVFLKLKSRNDRICIVVVNSINNEYGYSRFDYQKYSEFYASLNETIGRHLQYEELLVLGNFDQNYSNHLEELVRTWNLRRLSAVDISDDVPEQVFVKESSRMETVFYGTQGREVKDYENRIYVHDLLAPRPLLVASLLLGPAGPPPPSGISEFLCHKMKEMHVSSESEAPALVSAAPQTMRLRVCDPLSPDRTTQEGEGLVERFHDRTVSPSHSFRMDASSVLLQVGSLFPAGRASLENFQDDGGYEERLVDSGEAADSSTSTFVLRRFLSWERPSVLAGPSGSPVVRVHRGGRVLNLAEDGRWQLSLPSALADPNSVLLMEGVQRSGSEDVLLPTADGRFISASSVLSVEELNKVLTFKCFCLIKRGLRLWREWAVPEGVVLEVWSPRGAEVEVEDGRVMMRSAGESPGEWVRPSTPSVVAEDLTDALKKL